MKSRCELWLIALQEIGEQLSVSTTDRSAETACSRVAREGDSFLRVTLPQFAKDFEKSLAAGYVDSTAFRGFGRRRHSVTIYDYVMDEDDCGEWLPITRINGDGGLPKFLGELLDLVFDEDTHITSEDWTTFRSITSPDPSGATDRILRDRKTAEQCLPSLRVFSTPEEEERAAMAIRGIRQLCYMFSKEKELCSDLRIEQSIASFVDVDGELDRPF